ncbi:MAG: hypothetical protein KDD89_06220 [Anaerolineales bacterium]|nr:hypothetical protein [Anaerolineales bacterium]
MTYNRFGTLLSILFTLGWLIAIGVNLIVWFPQLLGADPMFYDHGREYLLFVAENQLSWAIFHIGASSALLILLPLISHLSQLRATDPNQPALQTIGLVGAFSALLASLIDQFATAVLARWQHGNIDVAYQLWETMEPFRDNGLKTLSFLLLGVWALWLAGAWLGTNYPHRRLGRFTQVIGGGLLLLGLIELAVPLPWRNIIGETGVAGLVLFPFWGMALARWFWQAELAHHTHES